MIDIKIKKLHPNSVIPQYAKAGDAGMDLTAVDKKYHPDYVEYKLGIAIEVPEGYVALIFPRSSVSGVDMVLSNAVGVIDSGYRGEISARFKKILNPVNHCSDFDQAVICANAAPKEYEIGDRVAQMIIIPYPQINFVEVEELSDTEREASGFGSSGK